MQVKTLPLLVPLDPVRPADVGEHSLGLARGGIPEKDGAAHVIGEEQVALGIPRNVVEVLPAGLV